MELNTMEITKHMTKATCSGLYFLRLGNYELQASLRLTQ